MLGLVIAVTGSCLFGQKVVFWATFWKALIPPTWKTLSWHPRKHCLVTDIQGQQCLVIGLISPLQMKQVNKWIRVKKWNEESKYLRLSSSFISVSKDVLHEMNHDGIHHCWNLTNTTDTTNTPNTTNTLQTPHRILDWRLHRQPIRSVTTKMCSDRNCSDQNPTRINEAGYMELVRLLTRQTVDSNGLWLFDSTPETRTIGATE